MRRVPAPVRRGMLPDDGAGGMAHRPNGSDLPFRGLPIRRGGLRGMPAAAPVRGGKTGYGTAVQLHRRVCCSRPGPCSRARPLPSTGSAGWWWSTGWRGWSNWESVSPATSAASKRFQLYLAATVANLTLVASKAGMTGEPGSGPSSGPSAGSPQVAGMVNAATAWLGQILTLSLLVSGLTDQIPLPNKGFPSGFLGEGTRQTSSSGLGTPLQT